jgi:hypothetical protein
MLDKETIAQQLELLGTYRRTLAHLLRQAAQFGGEVFAPPQTANGIAEARAEIRRIKEALRESGVAVEDEPNDNALPQVEQAQVPLPSNDQFDARRSQGFINEASGPISQNFGDQTKIDTSGGSYAHTASGDVAGRDIDKRQGIFIEGYTQPPRPSADYKLFQKLKGNLPANGSIHFITQLSFGDAFYLNELNDLRNFVENWNTVDYEFMDEEIESKKVILYDVARNFLRVVATNTFQLDNGTQSIEKSWRYQEPERYSNAVKEMNELADETHKAYVELIRLARRKLEV